MLTKEVFVVDFYGFTQDVFLLSFLKKDEVSFIKDFRPIGLCNAVYKAIAHLISQHLCG